VMAADTWPLELVLSVSVYWTLPFEPKFWVVWLPFELFVTPKLQKYMTAALLCW
jgi:hypothetical protein